MNSIPTSDDIFYTQITTLDGSDYLLEFRFNTREGVWYLQISLTDGTLLATGIKLVSNWPLLQKFADPRMPPGELMALAQGPDDSPAGQEELGIGLRVELTYFSHDELPSGFDKNRDPFT
jgi:hypothetical protein